MKKLNENGLRSKSSSFDSDASIEHGLKSDELDPDHLNDTNFANSTCKIFTQNDKYIKENISNGDDIDQRKIFNKPDYRLKDRIPSLASSIDEGLNQNENCSSSRSPKGFEKTINKGKREFFQNDSEKKNSQNKTLSSLAIIGESRLDCTYDFCDENKIPKRDFDELKSEHEEASNKKLDTNDMIFNNFTKQSASASPFKEKRRKYTLEKMDMQRELSDQGTVQSFILAPSMQKPILTKIYYSYFEQGSDDKDEIREIK